MTDAHRLRVVWFADDQRDAFLDFWSAYVERADEVTRAVGAVLVAVPRLRRVCDSDDLQAHRREGHVAMLHAVATGDWGPYEVVLRGYAAAYASAGVAFSDWHRTMHAVETVLTAHLVDAHGAEPARLKRALEALSHFLDRALVVLAERFIEAQAAALEERAAYEAALLEAAHDAIVTVDETGHVLELNTAAERTFGHSRDGAAGADVAELLVVPRMRQRYVDGFRRCVESDASILGGRFELDVLRADGGETATEATISRLPGDGPPVFRIFLRDLTAERAARRALADSERWDPLESTCRHASLSIL